MAATIPIPVGRKFGRLTVISLDRSKPGRFIVCRCDCGAKVSVSFKLVRRGTTKSCGCFRRDVVAAKNTVHGMKGRQEYGHWKGMRQRCHDPNHHKYLRYGGRGVVICEAWNDFAKFLEDVGPIPGPGYSLDRFPNRHGNYEPGNVRWATAKQQARNKDSTQMVKWKGCDVALIELAEQFGINTGLVRLRMKNGWSLSRALSTPPRLGRNQYD